MVTVDSNGNLATAPVPVCRCRPVTVGPRPPVVVRPAPKPVKPLGKKK
jgi:hypothetical protein